MRTSTTATRGRPEAPDVTILGGGPAGLSAALGLEHGAIPYLILEAGPVHGGNARTIRYGEFLYDTGPHRFHDRDPGATRLVRQLLGTEIDEVSAPSRIYRAGRYVDFPLRPGQVLAGGGLSYAFRAMAGLCWARLSHRRASPATDFATFAVRSFGRTVAESFLIPFSEKLWGLPASELSPDVAGRRLPGFDLKAIVGDVLRRRARHLEGRFLYPRRGYGQIADAILACLEPAGVRYRCPVVGLEAEGDRITEVAFEENGCRGAVRPRAVINTLPVTLVTRMLRPTPPGDVLQAGDRLRFRDVILVTLFLEQESVSDAAVTYFPDPSLEFTRAHEPRNRSRAMSPPGRTSLVVEFPCFRTDPIWSRDREELVAGLIAKLDHLGIIAASRVFASDVQRLVNAYPIYSREYKEQSSVVLSHLRRYRNLWTIGRGGDFFYGHVHDFITSGLETANQVALSLNGGPP